MVSTELKAAGRAPWQVLAGAARAAGGGWRGELLHDSAPYGVAYFVSVLGAGVTGTVVAVVGPTAAGKSALSIALAHALDGEVVNADSMQLYRGMDIGTAKLTLAERDGVPHHLLDIWEVTEPASVAEYQRLARAAVDDILARGRVPLLVGGSGLYVRAVLERFEFPGTDAALRERLEAELAGSARRRCTRGCAPPTRRRREHPARQRPADRAGPGGDRAHRRAVRAPRCRSPTPYYPTRAARGRPGHRPCWTSGSRCGWTGCGRTAWCGDPRAGRARAARGADGESGARLPAGAALPRR